MTPPLVDLPRLLGELAGRGVRLWSQDGQLRFRAPQGALTEEHRATLRAHRADLLALLESEAGTGDLVPAPADRDEPFPLTDVQSAYLLGRTDAFDYGGVPCHGYLEVALGQVEPARVEDAWNALIARHGMLRAVVDPATGSQRVLPEVPRYRIEVRDLRGAAPAAVTAAVERTRAELSHARYQPTAWPLHTLRMTRDRTGCLLHVSVDLLIADFASVQLLLGELGRWLRGGTLPELEIGFRDYLLGQRALTGTSRYHRDREYWWRRLDELPARPELPLAEGRPAAGPVRFGRLQHRLAAPAWRALRDRAAGHGLTPSAVVLAGYAEVIGRWSRDQAFTLNLPLQNRLALHDQVCALAGDFTSVSLLAVDLTGPAGFLDRARTLGGQLLSDVDHRLCSGVEVLRELGRRRGQAAALMPVVYTGVLGGAGGSVGEIRYGISQTPQVWLDCQAVEQPDGLLVSWDVRDGVFPPGLPEDMFGAFTALLARLAADDADWGAPAPLDLPADQLRRRSGANRTAGPLPAGPLHEPLCRIAAAEPDRPAVVAGGRTVSYGELLARAGGLAGALRSTGVTRGELVAVVLDKGVDQVAAVLGTLLAGAAYLPIDTTQPAARRDRILTDAKVRTVLTHSTMDTVAWPGGLTRIAVDTVPAGSSTDPTGTPVDPDDLAYVIYTSGSTGTPKGVAVSHRAARNTVDDVNRRYEVTAGDRVLGLAQLGFDLSVYDIFGVLGAGGRLVLPDPDRRGDPSHWADLVAGHGVTVWNSVPAQAQMLSDYLVAAARPLPSLRLALLSGDWIPVPLPDAWRRQVPGLRVVSLGGATEAAIWSIHHPIGEVPAGARSIRYGRPLTNQRCHVLDGQLRSCPDLVPGELYIAGAGLATGYLHDERRTAERFIRHPVTGERLYRTGDLGRYLPDGDIEFLGRRDNQVKILGHRIELAEVESALATHPRVGGCAVVVSGEPPHRQLAAFVEPVRRGTGTGEDLRAAASAAGAEITAGLDLARVAGFSRRLDIAELASMLAALRAAGLFPDTVTGHSEQEIRQRARVAAPHHDLLRRWLAALVTEGLLTVHDGWYRAVRSDPVRPADAWAGVVRAWTPQLCPEQLLDYLRTNAERLDELLRGELDPVGLLFPAGRTELARAAYQGNVMARYLNRVAAATIGRLAERQPEPLRVLEVGGGVGATTEEVLAALAGRDVDYLFTDVSPFFLNRARDRFPGLRYALFDIDVDPQPQGLPAGGFDVVLCAGVLNNARHTGQTLARLRTLLATGGWLVITEPTREHYEVLASQAFMMTAAEDDRAAGTGSTFLTRDQWLAELRTAGTTSTICLPEPGSVLEPLGQHVFLARNATAPGRDAVPDPAGLAAHLATRLPAAMIPPTIQVLDALPLTANGKVDRAALLGRLPRAVPPPAAADRTAAPGSADPAAPPATGTAAPDGPAADDGPRDELEAQVAAILADVLGVERIPRHRSFFTMGADSLLLAQVAGRLPQEVRVAGELYFDSLLRQLMHQPTLAELADHLRGLARPDQTGAAPTSPLVNLGGTGTRSSNLAGTGTNGTGAEVVTVLVHEGIGTMAPYRDLADRLAGHGPVLGLAVADAAAYLALPSEALLDRLGADYAAALLAAGHTRVRLVGYCMGGVLATEVARAYTERGGQVESLTVISSHPPRFEVGEPLLVEHAFAKVLGVDATALGYPADEETLGRALRTVLADSQGPVPAGALAALSGDPELAEVAGQLAKLAGIPSGQRIDALASAAGGGDHLPGLYQVFRHSFTAAGRHRAGLYAGPITLLEPAGGLRLLAGMAGRAVVHWSEICLGELAVVEIPGDHFSCLTGENAGAVAALLTREGA